MTEADTREHAVLSDSLVVAAPVDEQAATAVVVTSPPAGVGSEPLRPGARRPGARRPGTTIVDVLRWVVGAASFVALAAYVVVALLRLRSGTELEWMEGGMVEEVRRVLAGGSLYSRPTLAATPYLYTPLFTYVSAAVAWVVGPGLEPLRAVSIVSSIVAFWAAGRLVVVETRDRWAGLATAGILAASYVLCGSWFDIGRVDSLMLALLLVGLVLARTASTTRAAVLAGVVMVLAVMAKQDALLPALACLPWLVRRGRRIGVAYGVALVGGVAAAVALLQVTSDGWFLYYAVDVPAAHHLVPSAFLGFFTQDLQPFGWLAAMSVLALVAAHRRTGTTGVRWWFFAPVLASLVATGWLGRVHSGGWDNVLIPAVAGLAVLGGIALAVARHRGTPLVAGLCMVLVLVQFVGLRWAPWDQVPSERAEERTVAAVEAIADLRGPVYLPGHPWLLTVAGHRTNAQSAALADVLRGPVGPARDGLRQELETAIREQQFGSVVVDSARGLSYLPKDFPTYYTFDRALLAGGGRIVPVTGMPTGPFEVWVRRTQPSDTGD